MNSTFSSITINNISIKYNRWQVLAKLFIMDNYRRRVDFPFYYSRITILVTAASSSSLVTSWIKESLISLSGEVTSLLVNTMSCCNATYTSSSLITSWTKGGMSGSLQAQNSVEPKLGSSMLPTPSLMASTMYRSESASSKSKCMLSPSPTMSSFTKASSKRSCTLSSSPTMSSFTKAFDYNKISTTTSHVEKIQSTVMVAPNQSVHLNDDQYPVSDEKQRVIWTWIFICFSAVIIVIISITLLTVYIWKILRYTRHSVKGEFPFQLPLKAMIPGSCTIVDRIVVLLSSAKKKNVQQLLS
ncbi:uncharacterized protein LOC124440514 [Xenia sp. Carnegie-2017]|uniref:uncharacterized protein LOC124440514 n=1 Tax=Xenia sp. Carnegie-2017 TaxID=2897299 RepID=UPI001F03C710|nr:uncharacterized protein LOC124440514 [Xenia sp. Carnegie-2017]